MVIEYFTVSWCVDSRFLILWVAHGSFSLGGARHSVVGIFVDSFRDH
jgi:hypothetical protein